MKVYVVYQLGYTGSNELEILGVFKDLEKAWEQLADVPVDETGTFIEGYFYNWDEGDIKENIWFWFDERVEGGIGNRYFN